LKEVDEAGLNERLQRFVDLAQFDVKTMAEV